MSKNSFSINESNSTKSALKSLYRAIVADRNSHRRKDLDSLFEIAVENSAFPDINIPGDKNEKVYIEKWVSGYNNAMNNLPSSRTANAKSSCSDPAIKLLVQATRGTSDEDALSEESCHNLYMSAENIQGNLLEEYIALNTRKYGFLWCNGNVLHAIDFCNTDGSLLLQVKNKSNTENSSSSRIREGTNIIKWYRLGTSRVNGQVRPKFRWNELNDIINSHKTEGFDLEPCNMSEEDYEAFLYKVASENPNIITDK